MFLVDTHVVLWAVAEPARLGPGTTASLSGPNPVFWSAVSHAELVVKSMLGRLALPPNLTAMMRRQGFEHLPLTSDHAAALARFPALMRHDPFDRILLAQAASERLLFVTGDQRLLDPELDWVVDART